MNLVISKCLTAVKVSNFSGQYLGDRSTLDIGVLGYIGIVEHTEHPPEVWHVPPGTSCIHICIYSIQSISRSVATKVPRPYSFRFLSVGMDEKRSLQRKSKHKRDW
jgi:hypothetical protein